MKISYLLLCGILSTGVFLTSCNNAKKDPKNTQVLHENSKSFLQGVFPGMLITKSATLEKQTFSGSIVSTTLDNKISVDFDKQGNWTQVKSMYNAKIPKDFLLAEVPIISMYLQNNYPDNFVIEIQRIQNQGYEVELNSEFELIFDKDQNFIGIDLDYDDNEELVDFNTFPAVAKEFINKYFANSSVVISKREQDGNKATLKAYLSTGYKVQFDDNGQWKEISSNPHSAIPMSIINENIQNYLTTNYPNYVVTNLENDLKDDQYEVEIENENKIIDLIFNQQGDFIKID